MFFIDKYGVHSEDDTLMFHEDSLNILKVMAEDDSVPHIIFYGPEGAGKKAVIDKFLEMLYGPTVHKTNEIEYIVTGSGNNSSVLMIKQSNFHIVIEPNNNNFDRYMIHDIVKDYAQKVPLQFIKSNRSFKTVLINNVDNMSYYAQTSLRRTMEKYSHSCRFIMRSQSLSRVIDPLRSRCFCFRITPPTDIDIMKALCILCANEEIEMSFKSLLEIIEHSHGNIKEAMWLLELFYRTGEKVPFYKRLISRIVDQILELDLDKIKDIRLLFYRLMTSNISETRIVRMILDDLIFRENINIKALEVIVDKGATYEHRLVMSRRQIFQLDAFVVSIMKAVSDMQ